MSPRSCHECLASCDSHGGTSENNLSSTTKLGSLDIVQQSLDAGAPRQHCHNLGSSRANDSNLNPMDELLDLSGMASDARSLCTTSSDSISEPISASVTTASSIRCGQEGGVARFSRSGGLKVNECDHLHLPRTGAPVTLPIGIIGGATNEFPGDSLGTLGCKNLESVSSESDFSLVSRMLEGDAEGSTDEEYCRTPQSHPRRLEQLRHVHQSNDFPGGLCPSVDRQLGLSRSTSESSGTSIVTADPPEGEVDPSGTPLSGSRKSFHRYWKYAHQQFGATISGMMLNEKAEACSFSERERTEVLQWISEPLRNGGPVDVFVEIGAGIGRLTPRLMPLTKKLIAVDFLEAYIRQNEATNRDPNRSDVFLCQDALTLEFEVESLDVLFWNWFLMYLSDEEMQSFLLKSFAWIKVGGYVFCRESCGTPSHRADRSWAREGNPTKYRECHDYTEVLLHTASAMGRKFQPLFMGRTVSVYSNIYGTSGQKAWLFRRIA